jgi:hypothetical protein
VLLDTATGVARRTFGGSTWCVEWNADLTRFADATEESIRIRDAAGRRVELSVRDGTRLKTREGRSGARTLTRPRVRRSR